MPAAEGSKDTQHSNRRKALCSTQQNQFVQKMSIVAPALVERTRDRFYVIWIFIFMMKFAAMRNWHFKQDAE